MKSAVDGGKNQQAAPHPVPRLVASSPNMNGDSAGTDGNRWRVRRAPPDMRAWQRETFCWGSGHGSSLTFDPFPSVCLCLPGAGGRAAAAHHHHHHHPLWFQKRARGAAPPPTRETLTLHQHLLSAGAAGADPRVPAALAADGGKDNGCESAPAICLLRAREITLASRGEHVDTH